jgi:hypothetical protein
MLLKKGSNGWVWLIWLQRRWNAAVKRSAELSEFLPRLSLVDLL